MKIIWYSNTFGRVYAENAWIANAHKDINGNIFFT